LIVSIDAEGNYFISLGKEDNPEPVALESIGEDVAKIMNQNPAVPVFLEADQAVNYGVVMSLMSTLGDAGVADVNLITQPPSVGN